MKGQLRAHTGTLRDMDAARFASQIANVHQAARAADLLLGKGDWPTLVLQSGQKYNRLVA
jgi:hypothetical protein